jgi:hypothetical protein
MKIFSPILKGTTTVSQGTTNLSGSFTGSLFGTAATASYADNFTVGGTLTAQTINVQIITSSIEFNTGSTRNGALSTNTHSFTGSMSVSGTLSATDFIRGTCTTSYNGDGIRVYATATGAGGSQPGIGFWTAAGSKRFITQLDVSSDTWMVVNAIGTSHITVTQSGSLGIGTTSPGTKLHIANGDVQIQNANQTTGDFSQAQSLAFSQETGAYGASIKAIREAWSSMPFALTFLTNSVASGLTEKMRITSTGNIGAGGSTTNIYNASDIRLKKNINAITYGLNTVSSLNPVKFNWADGFEPTEADKTLLGFIAQEVQTVIPEAVESFGGSVDLNGITIENTLRVNEKFIIPVLVKAIQELKSENDTLKEILQRNNIQ